MLMSAIFVFSAPAVTIKRVALTITIFVFFYSLANSYGLLYYIKQYLGAAAEDLALDFCCSCQRNFWSVSKSELL